jgi:arginine exporter protein ArgO
MLNAALAGALAGYAIAVPVGAIAVLIIHTSITRGLRNGIAAAWGAASADGIYALAAVIVGGAATSLVSEYLAPFRLIAGVVLIGLAIRGLAGLRSTHDPDAEHTRLARHTAKRTYATFLGLTLLNPVTIAYFAALMVGLPSLTAAPERVAFALGAFVASVSWQMLLAAFGALLGRGSNRRIRVASAVIGNVIVLGFGLLILSQGL